MTNESGSTPRQATLSRCNDAQLAVAAESWIGAGGSDGFTVPIAKAQPPDESSFRSGSFRHLRTVPTNCSEFVISRSRVRSPSVLQSDSGNGVLAQAQTGIVRPPRVCSESFTLLSDESTYGTGNDACPRPLGSLADY